MAADVSSIPMPCVRYVFLAILVLLIQFEGLQGQQSYVNNRQLDCNTNYTTTLGYVCNGAAMSCQSYLTFRANPPYNNPVTIAYLLGANASEISRINNISEVTSIPVDTLVVVPLNCSCSCPGCNGFYQHNASYVLESTDTYFSVANNTFQALSTCQALIAQNPYNYSNLSPGMRVTVPLRCACPTANQTAAGFRYLLSYPVKPGDTGDSIANMFNVDVNSIYNANEISLEDTIFYFTQILIPLGSEPFNINTSASASPPSVPITPLPSGYQDSDSSNKWIYVGVGVGAALLLLLSLSGVLVWYFCCWRHSPSPPQEEDKNLKLGEPAAYIPDKPESKSWPEGLHLEDAMGSLRVYRFEELQKATNFFGEANRIEGSVYKGSFKGDEAAVKVMKGDISSEINVLKHINHSNIVKLSGFCAHQGNTYLVYEYAENGSLRDWLHLRHNKNSFHFQDDSATATVLGWKERVQIACDVADALNYLHNYANPPYIHKNLKSSNILLDANMRAKLVNFGLARAVNKVQKDQDEGSLLMTRHVVGTHGYMAPEYIENGLVTPKLDVFALGVVMLELLSGKEAAPTTQDGKDGEEGILSKMVEEILGGENVRENLLRFMDPSLRKEYQLDLAYSLAQLAKNCVSPDLNYRPTMAEVFINLSKILSSSLDWVPSDEFENSGPSSQGR